MLDETLSGMTEAVQGARATLLLGMDGMIVAGGGETGDLPGELLAASYADLLRRIDAIHREAGIDEVAELVVTSASLTLALRRVTAEYALAMVLDRPGSLGRARFELRKAASAIQPELAA